MLLLSDIVKLVFYILSMKHKAKNTVVGYSSLQELNVLWNHSSVYVAYFFLETINIKQRN